jgi:DNA polymerase
MDAFNLLRLQVEWGADEALEDVAQDRLRAPSLASRPQAGGTPAPAATTPSPRSPSPGSPSTGSPSEPIRATALASPAEQARVAAALPVEQARAAAEQADSLPALREAIAAFTLCSLRDTATNLVFAVGDPDAALLLVGDPPNADDDRSGTPFAGQDGRLLDTLLASAGLDRGRLLLSPLLAWRPPGGRPATPTEVAMCLPFLHRLIVLTRPRGLVLAGPQVVRAMIGARPRLSAAGLRATSCAVPDLDTPIDALLLPFPATTLRQPAARREAWAALRRMRRMMDGAA